MHYLLCDRKRLSAPVFALALAFSFCLPPALPLPESTAAEPKAAEPEQPPAIRERTRKEEPDEIAGNNAAAIAAFKEGKLEESQELLEKVVAALETEEYSQYNLAKALSNLATVYKAQGSAYQTAATAARAEGIFSSLHLKNLNPWTLTEIAPTSISRKLTHQLLVGAALARAGKSTTVQAPYLKQKPADSPTITFAPDGRVIFCQNPDTAAQAVDSAEQAKPAESQTKPGDDSQDNKTQATQAAPPAPAEEMQWKQTAIAGASEKQAGHFSAAEQLLKKAIALAEKFPQPDARLANSLNLLAGVYRHTDQLALAIPLYLHALSIIEKTDGAESPGYATVLDNLAQVYNLQGDFTRAEKMQKQALAIYEKTLGPDSTDLAETMSNIASNYLDQHKYKQSEELYLKALEIYKKTLPPDHPLLAMTYDNLGTVYSRQGAYGKAEELEKKAMVCLEKRYGAIHPELAVTLTNLATTCARQGKYKEAEALMKRTIDMTRKIFGSEHRRVAEALLNYAGLLKLMHRDSESRTVLKQAEAIIEHRKL